jgi:hypothetical protein
MALGEPHKLTKPRRKGLELRLAQRLHTPQIKIAIQQEAVKRASPM